MNEDDKATLTKEKYQTVSTPIELIMACNNLGESMTNNKLWAQLGKLPNA